MDGKQIDNKDWDLKAGESLYKVHINDADYASELNAMVCVAKSEYQARMMGQEYIRAWSLYNHKIVKISKVEL